MFGALLLVVACLMQFWAEGRSVHRAQALSEGAARVIDVDASRIDPDNNGKLVHVAGTLETQDTPTDRQLGVTAPKAVRLERRTEMFQWEEFTRSEETTDSTGKTVKTDVIDYRKAWSGKAIESRQFRTAGAPQNPPLTIAGEDVAVGEAKIGAYRLAGKDIASLGKAQALLLREEDRAAAAHAMGSGRKVTLAGNVLTVARDPQNPEIGDLRVTYQSAVLDKVSVVATQQGDSLGSYVASNGQQVFLLEEGIAPALAMFQTAAANNTALTWSLRLLGLILMFVGAKFALTLITRLGQALPVVGSLLQLGTTLIAAAVAVALSGLMIGLGWLFYRPLMALLIIAAGFALSCAFLYVEKRKGDSAPQRSPVR
jgi:hypothetical protein